MDKSLDINSSTIGIFHLEKKSIVCKVYLQRKFRRCRINCDTEERRHVSFIRYSGLAFLGFVPGKDSQNSRHSL